MLERSEAIGLLVILAVMLAATVWVAVRSTPSFGLVFAPVEVGLAGWVLSDMDGPDDDGGGISGGRSFRRGPPGRRGDGGSRVREPRRPRPGSGAGAVSRRH
jgi:hypothetical protein